MRGGIRQHRGRARFAGRQFSATTSCSVFTDVAIPQDIAKYFRYRTREFPRLFAGGAYPPNTLLIVDRLVREEFLLEVAAVAAL